jgi:hypothetical protein
MFIKCGLFFIVSLSSIMKKEADHNFKNKFLREREREQFASS